MKAWQLIVAACATGTCAVAALGDILAADITGARIMRLSGVDGSVIDADFIDMTPHGGRPWHATQVGSEVWVSQAALGRIERFSLDGDTWLGSIDPLRPAVFSLQYVEALDRVIVATGGSGRGGIAVIDPNTNVVESSVDVTETTFDVLYADGEVLSTGGDSSIWAWETDGTSRGLFADTLTDAGLDDGYQMAHSGPESFLVAAAGSTGGVAEYGFDGTLLNAWALPIEAFGITPLDGGDILFSMPNGDLRILDRATGTMTDASVDGATVTYLGTYIPTPGTGLIAIAGLIAMRRRR